MEERDGTELAFAGIARQAELLRGKEISSVELTSLYLERIERFNPRLNAFNKVFAESALEAAEAADAELSSGPSEDRPLLGVPVAFKDSTDVEGDVTGHGSRAFDVPAPADSEHVRRVRAAGAILIGRTALPELAIFPFTESEACGETRNPWNLEHTPGGSSGGSGAAVAAGLVGIASGSDGGGSIRIPAACCNLFGLKPQRGRIDLAPLEEGWLGLSVDGCLSRHVADTALYMQVAAASAPDESSWIEAASTPPPPLRVAISLKAPRALAAPVIAPEVRAAVERIGEVLRGLGHSVDGKDPAFGLIGTDAATRYIKGIENDIRGVPHPELLEGRTLGFKRLGRLIPEFALRQALANERKHAARINASFDDHDLLLVPVIGTPPPEVGHWAGQGTLRTLLGVSRIFPHTIPWNHLGNPAAAIPAGFTDEGLPLSVQLVAPAGREDLLLSVSAQLEAELGWADRTPAI